MNIPPAMSRCQPHTRSQSVLPNELIADILSMLTVKPLTRLRCVSKSWNSLISDPTFVRMHLQRSKRNTHLTLMLIHSSIHIEDCNVVPFPVRRLLENPSTTIPDDPCYRWNEHCDCCGVVGSCNGLLCLLFYSSIGRRMYGQNWLCFWNPATRIRSEKLGYFCNTLDRSFKLSFGYDNSTGIYKVVAFCVEGDEGNEASWRSEVRVFSLGDNSWRNIQSLPVVPLNNNQDYGVHLSGSLNWLALRKYFLYAYYYYDWKDNAKDITVEQFVIVSLDLSTETYTELLLPGGFDDVPHVEPTVGVLMDCLCFSHDFKGTDFVIWQMKEFGVRESWTQFLKISYQNLQKNLQMNDGNDDLEYDFELIPLCVPENEDTLILANEDGEDQAILYNWRDNRAEQTNITNEIWRFFAVNYVESLVSPS